MSEQSEMVSGLYNNPQIMKEHKEFVQDLVAYFKNSAVADSDWQTKWLTALERNGGGSLSS